MFKKRSFLACSFLNSSFLFWLLVSLSLFLLVVFSCFFNLPTKVCVSNDCHWVKKLILPWQKKQGMAYQKNTPGALMIFSDLGEYSIVTKRMNFILDVFWLDQEKKVVAVKKNIAPCQKVRCESISTPVRARYILETKAGLWPSLKRGDSVYF